MSDTITKWHEMQEENKEIIVADETAKYIFLLDFTDGKVYKYDVSSLCSDKNKWNPDSVSCEAFLMGAGHHIGNIEWMVTSEANIEYGN